MREKGYVFNSDMLLWNIREQEMLTYNEIKVKKKILDVRICSISLTHLVVT